jgi:hypothetical protein
MTRRARWRLALVFAACFATVIALISAAAGWDDSTRRAVAAAVLVPVSIPVMLWVMLEPDERREMAREARRRWARGR